jgi:type IV secretion system protein TrbF
MAPAGHHPRPGFFHRRHRGHLLRIATRRCTLPRAPPHEIGGPPRESIDFTRTWRALQRLALPLECDAVAASRVMKDLNPYVEARREWNDRYLDLVRARRWWQVAAVSELVLVATLGGGLVALSLQHKTVPYVVEVDSLGAAVAVKPADAAGRPTDERIVRYQLVAFIRGARAVMTDRAAMKRSFEQVYAYARGPARMFLDDHYRASNPFETAKTYTVSAAVTSLLQVSDRSWQVRWSEEQRGLDGTLLGRSNWEAVLTVEIAPPTTADAIQANPFGLYVTEIRWTKQL